MKIMIYTLVLFTLLTGLTAQAANSAPVSDDWQSTQWMAVVGNDGAKLMIRYKYRQQNDGSYRVKWQLRNDHKKAIKGWVKVHYKYNGEKRSAPVTFSNINPGAEHFSAGGNFTTSAIDFSTEAKYDFK